VNKLFSQLFSGVAWLSLVRAVRRQVKSLNERNPYLILFFFKHSPFKNGRKVRMMSSPHGPYELGYTRATMVITKSCKDLSRSQSYKNYLSSDYRLKLAYMKSESLVIVDQKRYGEYVLKLCTHCPSHRGSHFF